MKKKKKIFFAIRAFLYGDTFQSRMVVMNSIPFGVHTPNKHDIKGYLWYVQGNGFSSTSLHDIRVFIQLNKCKMHFTANNAINVLKLRKLYKCACQEPGNQL